MKILQWLLYLRVRSSRVSHAADTKTGPAQQNDQPVFYFLRYRSLTDALVVDREARSATLPTGIESIELPLGSTTETSQKALGRFWHRFVPLTRPGTTEISSKSPRHFSRKFRALVKNAIDNPQFDAQLIPVSVFWGRSPGWERSVWQAVSGDGWSIPGFFRKFLMIVLKGGQTYVQFGEAMSLRQIVRHETDSERALAKTHRLIRQRIRKQREAFIGPDLSHRRTLLLSLLDTPAVRSRLEREAESKSMSMEKARAKALSYANEIAADYSHPVIRTFHIMLSWLWTRIYDGVRVYNGDMVQRLAQHHTVVYVPSHRSHIDYLLLSYVLYAELDLVPPHIAAGINLNLPIIGPLLRRGGAFFMRRSFRDDPLYGAIFAEYLHRVFERGFSIEYFIEGGRSRTGRQLSPKPGMLNMTLKSYDQASSRSLVFVPVNFCYERLFEGKSYLGELRGKKKNKETLSQLIKSIKRIKENFGQVHVAFGQALSAEEFLLQQQLSSEKFTDLTHIQQKQAGLALGHLLSVRINEAATAHAIALLSLILHATPQQAITQEELKYQLDFYIDFFHRFPYSSSAHITDLAPDEIIEHGQAMGYLSCYPHQYGDIYFATEKQAQYLSYFRNNVAQLFALPSMLCLASLDGTTEINTLVQRTNAIYPLVRREYFLRWHPKELNEVAHPIANYLEERDLFTQPNQRQPRHLLAGIVRPSIERYSITLSLLEQAGSSQLSGKELEHQGRLHAERISRLYKINSPEYFDPKLFSAIIQELLETQLIAVDENGKLSFGQQLHITARETEAILDQFATSYVRPANSPL